MGKNDKKFIRISFDDAPQGRVKFGANKFHAGEIVSGRVLLRLDKPTEITNLKMEVRLLHKIQLNLNHMIKRTIMTVVILFYLAHFGHVSVWQVSGTEETWFQSTKSASGMTNKPAVKNQINTKQISKLIIINL